MTKKLEKSIKLKERADKVIPHQTGTFSRAAGSFVVQMDLNFLM